jgi:hypothetical protein
MAVRYGVAGTEEARAYLRDPTLAGRLVSAAGAVRAHVDPRGARAAALEDVMGSSIDAAKLVSSMTLFRGVAQSLLAEEPRPEWAALVEHADAILAAARSQGHASCSFTEEQLRRMR